MINTKWCVMSNLGYNCFGYLGEAYGESHYWSVEPNKEICYYATKRGAAEILDCLQRYDHEITDVWLCEATINITYADVLGGQWKCATTNP